MSAKRCLSAWYDASGRPKELRSTTYSSVNSNTRSSRADGFRALEHDGELQLAFDRGGGVVELADEPRRGTRTSSKRTVAKRRTRSTDPSGSTVMPDVPAGTRNCVSPPVPARSRAVRRPGRLLRPGGDAVEHEAVAVARGRHRDAGSASMRRRDRRRTSAPITSPAMIPGSTSARSSAEPPAATAAATMLMGPSGPGDTRRPISSATITRSSRPSPLRLPPPSDSGTRSDVHPSSAPRTPPAAVEPGGIVDQRAHRGERRLLLEELPGRLLEELLVVGEREMHRLECR